MPRMPDEGMPQAEVVLRLRGAIDTAERFPSQFNNESALRLAREHPMALRSSHAAHNLGQRRWQWLADHGITTVGEPHEIAGQMAFNETIKPDITG